jgi:hypothetical protein
MNETISTALRDHADGDIHIERLLSAVHAGARRRRQRRLALACGAVVVAALVGVTGAVSTRQPATIAGPALEAAIPRPPHVERVPAAADAPEVLGADPSLFHLDLTGLTGWTYLSWSSRRGHEELAVTMESGDQVLIEADRDRGRLRRRDGRTWAVTVGGKPAEAVAAGASHMIRWQPVPGIWAQVDAIGDVDMAIGFAENLWLDRVYRCAVPFRLDRVTSVRMIKCETYYTADEDTDRWTAAGGVWFTIGDGGPEYQVAVGKSEQPIVVNDTIEGRAVEVVEPTGNKTLEIRYPYDGRTAYFWAFYGPVDPGVVRSLVAGFSPITDEDQHAWPRTPFA